MTFVTSTAPHWRTQETVASMMRRVIYALIPAIAVYVVFFGIGVIVNCLIACIVAVSTEAAALFIRRRPIRLFLFDYSAVVTAILLAFCLPALTPWWVTATGSFFAIAVAKHLYGGLGFNVFNPAMAGYVVLIVSFPEALSNWTAPSIGLLDYEAPTAFTTLWFALTGALPDGSSIDAITRATPLNVVQTELGQLNTIDEIRSNPLFGDFAGRGWEWINSFVALGGFWLLYKGIIRWHVPVSMLGALAAASTLASLLDSSVHPGPTFHLFSGGTLLCAFFIATDPVSGAQTRAGKIIYGAGIGFLTFVIRTWGVYPDGIAFSVLLMNMAAPLIDRYTRPRAYGRAPTPRH
jgi:electron transport complex protein RnfD